MWGLACALWFLSKIKFMGKAKKERPAGPDKDERTGVPNNMPAD
jgi:hypothetical protein